jgi:hypothetical protein
MKISLTKHGGLAAGMRRPPVILENVTPAQAAEIDRLVAAVKSSGKSKSKETEPGKARDAMSYTIALERDGKKDGLTGSDSSMTPEFSALMEWIERHAGR